MLKNSLTKGGEKSQEKKEKAALVIKVRELQADVERLERDRDNLEAIRR
jgi:outer membrane murein-binding lipoprotein Lpp